MKILALILSIFTLIFHTQAEEHCPRRFNLSPTNDVCTFTEKQDYTDIQQKCKTMGGIGLKIRNAKENALILKKVKSEFDNVSPYIGVEKKPNGTWLNSDGSELEYENWTQASVGSFFNRCAIVDPENGKWIPAECSIKRPYFCTVTKMDHVGDVSQCPSGWIYSRELEYCYFLKNFTLGSTQSLSSYNRHSSYSSTPSWELIAFDEADAQCKEKNSHLVSIHSRQEEQFIYDLLATNVKNLSTFVSDNQPCKYTVAFIGLQGNGKINGTSTWTDGTPMNFTGYPWGAATHTNWGLINDDSCDRAREWRYSPGRAARYICKMASLNRLESEN